MIKWGLFINKIDTKAFLIVYSDISWDVLNHKNVMYPAIIVSCIINENIFFFLRYNYFFGLLYFKKRFKMVRNFTYISSNFDVVFVVEWIVLRTFSIMLMDFPYLLRFSRKTWPKQAEKCLFPKFEGFFYSILIQFFFSKCSS